MNERVKVYTRPLCLFCHQVIDLLRQANVAFAIIEISDRRQQEELTTRHQAAAFPLVMVDGRYIGGYAHVLHLHSQGRLRNLTSTPEPPPGTPTSSGASPAASAISSPARPSQNSIPSMISAMSRLQQALNETDPKKR